MGIKFKNRVSVGAPTGGDVKERELVLDLKNSNIYSSNDGVDLVKLGGGTEIGGIAWLDATDYIVGDMVTEGIIGYVCITAHTSLTTDATDGEPSVGVNWSVVQATAAEKGGIPHSALTTYTLGDIVTSAGIPYVCTTVPATNPGAFDPTEWTAISEQGGITWKAGVSYVVGDIISNGGNMFGCSVGHLSTAGDTAGGSPTQPASTNWVLANNLFNVGVDYLEGNTVVFGDDIFIAPVAGIASGGLAPTVAAPGAWLIASSEIGGITYQDNVSYAIGDVVTNSGVTYQCSAPTTGAVAPVVFDIADWSLTGLSTLEDFATTAADGFPLTWGTLAIREGATWRVQDTTLSNLVGTQTVAVGDMIIALIDNAVVLADFNIIPGVGSISEMRIAEDFVTTATGDYPATYDSLPIQAGATWIVRDVTASNRIGGDTGFPLSVGDTFTALVDLPAGAGNIGGPTSDWATSAGVQPDIASFAVTTDGEYPQSGGGGGISSTGPGINAYENQRIRAGTVFVVTDTAVGSYVGTKRIRPNSRITARVDNPGATTDADWSVETLAVSGEPWDPTFSYFQGESVVVGDNTWIALITTTAGDVPNTVPLQWRPAERSGRLWNSAYTYIVGDTAVFGSTFYLAIADSTNAQPDSATAFWKTIDSDRYNVATFTPTNGNTAYDGLDPAGGGSTEYPDYTGETVGATWMVAGLPDTGYVIASGPGAGLTVLNGDKYVLIQPTDGVASNTDWYQEIAPRVSGERAGLAWSSTLDYYTGDIVSDAGATYMAIANMFGTSSQPSITPGEWTALDVYGRIWNTDTNYVIGDIVSHGGNSYIALAPGSGNTPAGLTNANWKITTAGRGIQWDNAEANYIVGDVVSDNFNIYTCIFAPVTVAASPSATPSQWKLSEAIERGGVAYKAATAYIVGDVITADDGTTVDVYRCITGYTSAAGGLPADFLAEVGNWTVVGSAAEVGGIAFDPAISTVNGYVAGDIVVEVGVAYFNTTGANTTPGTFVPADWTPIGTPEQGGIAWLNGTSYVIGDIITEGTTGYVCTVAHLADDTTPGSAQDKPSTGGSSWSVIQATAAEKGGVAHDATTAYDLGDMVTNGGVPYVCHTLPTPNPGVFDPLEWTLIGGVEVGGVAWTTGTIYNVGDVVVDTTTPGSEVAYYCETTHTASAAFATDAANWVRIGTPEQGGVAWTTGILYSVGDVVVDAGVAYMNNLLHTASAAFATDAANWDVVDTPERGGIAFDTAKSTANDYVTGDVVVEAGIAYFNTTGANTTPGTFVPADWTRIGTPEKGGLLFDAATDYVLGDVVTYGVTPNELLYRCTTAHTAAAWNAANFTLIETPEIGGREYSAAETYAIGDIVSNAGVAYRAIAASVAVAFDPLNWESIEVPERGGILHTTVGQVYAVGDIVNLAGSSFMYVCKTAHTSTVDCNLAPDDINWYQPAVVIPVLEYNFISTDLAGAVPPAVPGGTHAHEHDGLTGIPDENGQYYFSVAKPSAGKTATVYVDGFKLRPDEYRTTLDGYVEIFSPVSDNSWTQITV